MKKILSFILVAIIALSVCGCVGLKPQKLAFINQEVTVKVGESATLELVADIKANNSLEWTSSNTDVLTVEGGVILGKKSGNAIVTVKSKRQSATCNVTVVEKEIKSITLSHSSATIKIGNTLTISATVTPEDADSNLKWSSSKEDVAVVNSDGRVTAIKAGVANIKCQAENGVEASCTVTVKADSSDIKVTYSEDTVFPDSSTRKLTRGEIEGLSKEAVQLAINDIYARNGYVFKKTHLYNYYSAKSWYNPDPNFSTNDFNEVERYNVNLLTEYK
ncbi:MAG: Ig-like domain-containing protein [Clostridia bacterium]|nr:Ig-like domain-containing protein [Clostridia bacterium]